MAMKEMVAPTGLNAPPEAEKRTLNSDCKFRVVRKRMKWLKGVTGPLSIASRDGQSPISSNVSAVRAVLNGCQNFLDGDEHALRVLVAI